MENNNKNIGIINEQGYVVGSGLGFSTLTEQDKEKINKDNNNKEEKE